MPRWTQRAKAAWSAITGKSWQSVFNQVGASGSDPKMTKPLKQSAWVLNAIDKLSGPISSVPVEYSLDPEFDQSLEKPDNLKRWMYRPALGMKWSDFTYASVAWLSLEGEYFWLLDDAWMVPHLDVKEILPPVILPRPQDMRHVVVDGQIVGWEYRSLNGQRWYLPPEQVIHRKTFNPDNPHRGLGKLEAARNAAETDWLGSRLFRSLMRDNGDRGDIFIAKQGITDDTQREQITAQLREAARKRRLGEPAPLFLTSDVEKVSPSVFSPDASYWQGRVESRKEIFAAFNVPLSMADTQASYSIGSASDYYRLIQEGCVPLGEMVADGCEQISSRLMGREVYARMDWDEHPVMQEVRRERFASVDTFWTKGMPMSKVSEYLNLGLPRYQGDEVGYLPFSVAPVGSSDFGSDPFTDPSLAEDTDEQSEDTGDDLMEDPAVEAMLRALGTPIETPAAQGERAIAPFARSFARFYPEPRECACCGKAASEEGQAFQDDRPAKEVSTWRRHQRERAAIRKAYASKYSKQLYEARRDTLQKIAALDPASYKTKAPSVGSLLFSLADFRSGLVAALSSVSADALQKAGEGLYAELGKADAWTAPAPFVQDYLRARSNYIAGAADTVYEAIKSQLEAGIQSGETMAQLAGRVKATFKGINSYSAQRIAATETSAVYGGGRHKAMQLAGIGSHQWITSGNANVRAAHRAANGQIQPIGEPFIVDGERLMYPSDPAGSKGNTINCHCTTIAVETPES